jgi:hypothetical protein
MDKVFEMLWDCGYCGTRKLLGKTHRFCPGCGAPQDPKARYFPAEEDKVEVHDHVFVGADRHCPACQSAMSAKAVHCTQCGSPLEGAAVVPLVSGSIPASTLDPPAPAPAPVPLAQPLAPKPSSRWGRWLGLAALVMVLGCCGFCSLFFFTEKTQARVAGRTWARSIEIESFQPQSAAAWCDRMPAGAYGVKRSRKESGTRRIPTGQDCHTRRVDQGDGTFREKRECTTRYREESVQADYCTFTVNAWSVARTAETKGTGAELPAWPAVSLRAGECLGCEREGKRTGKYTVTIALANDKTTCDVSEEVWSKAPDGAVIEVEKMKLGGLLLCSSLTRP